jgi:hypothetical protein
MMPLRILVWNADGVSTKLPEVECFVRRYEIDVLLLSETHCKEAQAPRIFGFESYTANDPSDGNAKGGAAILVKSSLVHFPLTPIATDKVQVASAAIETGNGPVNFGAIYCPPRFIWDTDEFKCILDQQCSKLLVAGDWNASHWLWGAGRCNQRGRALANLVLSSDMSSLATGVPTRFPYGSRGSPGYIDFAVTRGILDMHAEIRSVAELSSDHLPLIITLDATATAYPKMERLIGRHTDLERFHELLESSLNLSTAINSERDIEEAVDTLTHNIKAAASRGPQQLKSRSPERFCSL